MKWTQAISTGIALWVAAVGYAAAAPENAPSKPRLILTIVVDQFRADYTTRFAGEYKGGIAALLKNGAVFPDAHQDHFPTVTAPGHTTVLTGSVPATSGIIGNEWYDRKSGRVIIELLLLLLIELRRMLLSPGFLSALRMSCLAASSVPVGAREESRCCHFSAGLEGRNALAIIGTRCRRNGWGDSGKQRSQQRWNYRSLLGNMHQERQPYANDST